MQTRGHEYVYVGKVSCWKGVGGGDGDGDEGTAEMVEIGRSWSY